jgi:sulfur relay (sulfurtransferase) DsrC/TusE family protein
MNEKLKKQIKKLSKYVPKHIFLVPEIKDRELTKAEMKVIQSYLEFYELYNFVPLNGMKIKHFSEKSYLDFAFMNKADDKGRYCIYLNLK